MSDELDFTEEEIRQRRDAAIWRASAPEPFPIIPGCDVEDMTEKFTPRMPWVADMCCRRVDLLG